MPVILFHSMLVAYAILVPTLYGNHRLRLKVLFFRSCSTKSLTSFWVECQAADNFIFFDVKHLIYTYVKSVTRCCSNNIPWIAWIFSCEMLLGPLEQHCMGPRLPQKLTLNGTFSLCKVVWSLLGNIAEGFSCAVLSKEY